MRSTRWELRGIRNRRRQGQENSRRGATTAGGFLLAAAVVFSPTVHAQDRHPGVMGKDAPGGEVVSIRSNELTLRGVLYRPKGSEAKRLPAIVVVHGWSPYGTRAGEPYTYVAQEYADAGFVALAITLRGWPETGGTDDCGLKQPADIVNAARWLARQPGVDEKNIGLVGQSLGGQIVLSAAALNSVVKATVAYFPITDFRLWGVTTSLNDSVKSDYIYGMCTNEGTPEARSPLTTSEQIKGAVLLQHGELDRNVIVAHSKLMHQKMLEAGQDVTLYIGKGGRHGSGGPGWENHMQRSFAFFREKLGGEMKKTK